MGSVGVTGRHDSGVDDDDNNMLNANRLRSSAVIPSLKYTLKYISVLRQFFVQLLQEWAYSDLRSEIISTSFGNIFFT